MKKEMLRTVFQGNLLKEPLAAKQPSDSLIALWTQVPLMRHRVVSNSSKIALR